MKDIYIFQILGDVERYSEVVFKLKNLKSEKVRISSLFVSKYFLEEQNSNIREINLYFLLPISLINDEENTKLIIDIIFQNLQIDEILKTVLAKYELDRDDQPIEYYRIETTKKIIEKVKSDLEKIGLSEEQKKKIKIYIYPLLTFGKYEKYNFKFFPNLIYFQLLLLFLSLVIYKDLDNSTENPNKTIKKHLILSLSTGDNMFIPLITESAKNVYTIDYLLGYFEQKFIEKIEYIVTQPVRGTENLEYEIFLNELNVPSISLQAVLMTGGAESRERRGISKFFEFEDNELKMRINLEFEEFSKKLIKYHLNSRIITRCIINAIPLPLLDKNFIRYLFRGLVTIEESNNKIIYYDVLKNIEKIIRQMFSILRKILVDGVSNRKILYIEKNEAGMDIKDIKINHILNYLYMFSFAHAVMLKLYKEFSEFDNVTLDIIENNFIISFKLGVYTSEASRRFLESEISKIREKDNLIGNEEVRLKEIFESRIGSENRENTENITDRRDSICNIHPRNFFAHSGLERKVVLVKKINNKIALRYDPECHERIEDVLKGFSA